MTTVVRDEKFFVRDPAGPPEYIATQGVFTIDLPGITSWRIRIAAWAIAFIAERFLLMRPPELLDRVSVTLEYGVVKKGDG